MFVCSINSVFNTIILIVCFPIEPWLCPHPEGLIRNCSSVQTPCLPFSGHADGVSFLAGNSLCRRCCQSVFINWLPEALSSWPPFPQMIKSFCLTNHFDLMAFRVSLQLSLEEWEVVNTAMSGLVNRNEFPEILILLLFIAHPGERVKNGKKSKTFILQINEL